MYLHPGYELNALDSWLVWMHHKCRDVGSRNLTKASQLTIPVITAVNNSRSSTYAKICSCPWTKSELWSDNVQTIFYFLFAVRMNKNFLWVNLNFFCDVDHNFLSDQDGVNMSFQEKKLLILQPCSCSFWPWQLPSLTKSFVAVIVFEIYARFRFSFGWLNYCNW